MSRNHDNQAGHGGYPYDVYYREPDSDRLVLIEFKTSARSDADRQPNLFEVWTEDVLASVYRFRGVATKDQSNEEKSSQYEEQLKRLLLSNIETGVDFIRVPHHGTSVTRKPPKYGERLLYLLLSKDERKNLIGDLAEEYIELQAKHGLKFARVWYWKQVCGSFFSLAVRAVRWGLYAGIVEWVRRHI